MNACTTLTKTTDRQVTYLFLACHDFFITRIILGSKVSI